MKYTFSKKARQALNLMQKTKKNVFITGKAGTGKSTLLEYFRENAPKKPIVLAPTGVAAINVKGDTIHSFFGLKPGFELDEAREKKVSEKRRKKYQYLKTILIDEISMVRADLLDAVDIFLRKARENDNPFGGIQMIFFGDLYQLPPVITSADKNKFFSEYDAPYFFNAKVFQGANNLLAEKFELECIELDKIYRQKDEHFINILNAVRDNSVTHDHLSKLNERWKESFIPSTKENYIHLMTTNADADTINSAELSKLNTEKITFHAQILGKIARNLRPNNEKVTVKIGAQIMFINNDSERRWVNGTIGKIEGIRKKYNEETEEIESVLVVKVKNGGTVEVAPHTWEISKYVFQDGEFQRETMGSFKQIPVKLAWAITIHKSQGKTFEKVVIDLGRGSFAHGQTYVALSRCTSLEGIVLKKRLQKSHIIMDKRVELFGK